MKNTRPNGLSGHAIFGRDRLFTLGLGLLIGWR